MKLWWLPSTLAATVALSLFTCCSPKSGSNPRAGGAAQPVLQHWVTLPPGTLPGRAAVLHSAVVAHTLAWEANMGQRLPSASISLVDGPLEGGAYGLTEDGGRITAWASPGFAQPDTCPLLYHEFCHLAFGDRHHKDPQWPLWEKQAMTVWVGLGTQR